MGFQEFRSRLNKSETNELTEKEVFVLGEHGKRWERFQNFFEESKSPQNTRQKQTF